NIRRSIAARRGIELEFDVVAKLMVLEVLLPDQFQAVLSWLRTGELRERLETLETLANRAKEGIPQGTSPVANSSKKTRVW
ncbi:hypothetical protein NSP34_25780, partial [Salmonella enterica]|nr:hypothetical protein [Salmonella enterica]